VPRPNVGAPLLDTPILLTAGVIASIEACDASVVSS
jgi:hypothetical protein